MSSKQPRARTFTETSEKHGTMWRRVAVVCCRDCNTSDRMGISTGNSLLPTIAISKKFSQRGWEIGQNENWDFCPDCVAKREAKSKKPNLKIVEAKENTMKPELAVVADQPRTMQRDDRRIIFEKLNEVYLDEKRGYDSGWSDHKVSLDLGVPRAWVEQVRDEMFGPVGSNEDMVAFKKGVEELRAFKDKIEAVKAKIAEYQRMVDELELSVMADKITKLEKLGENIKKLIP